jgi:hypothetical protein
MTAFDYTAAPVPIRDDLAAAHRRTWQHLASPGTWWSGAERVAIAAETRRARSCAYCAELKSALSPHVLTGRHDSGDSLPAPAIDLVHRVTTDASRLTRRWYEATLAAGLDAERYVEALGLATLVVSIDAFHHALGLPLEPLPAPLAGAPTRRRPAGVAQEDAFVPMLRPDRLGPGEKDLFGGMPRTGNVLRALSLVPDQVRELGALSAAHYLTPPQMMRFDSPRAIDRAQIELIAGRVSALRECFY